MGSKVWFASSGSLSLGVPAPAALPQAPAAVRDATVRLVPPPVGTTHAQAHPVPGGFGPWMIVAPVHDTGLCPQPGADRDQPTDRDDVCQLDPFTACVRVLTENLRDVIEGSDRLADALRRPHRP